TMDLADLQRDYLADVETTIATMREQGRALGERGAFKEAFPKLLFLAHQLKGSGGSLGFPRISDVARSMHRELNLFLDDERADRLDEHTEDARSGQFVERVEAGETIAVVSDAGMPVVSDPGYRIVRLARERGVVVEPIPGPFAGVLALAASGIAPLPFTFLGFSPHRHGERLHFHRRLPPLGHPPIVYDSP